MSNFLLATSGLPARIPKMRKILLFACVLCLFARGSELKFEKVGMEDGLSQGYVNFILQDSRGFMWFATPNGLNRYDGHQVKVYKQRPFDENSLNDSTILWIFEGQKGRIWIGTKQGGLNCLDPRTDQFVHFTHDPEDAESISSDMVFGIFESATEPGILWVGTDHGLCRMDVTQPLERASFERFHHIPSDPSSLSSNHIRPIYEDDAGRLWIGTWDGLNLLDRKTGRFKRFLSSLAQPDHRPQYHITAITSDNENQLWIGTYGDGLIQMDLKTGQFTHFEYDMGDPDSISSMVIFSILKDQRGDLWIGTDNGLNLLRSGIDRFIRYEHHSSEPTSLSHNGVLSLYECPSGVIWAGTNTGGLNKFHPKSRAFKQISNHSKGLSIIENSIYSIHEASSRPGFVWIGTAGGYLYQFDRNQYNIKPILVDDPRLVVGSHIHLRALFEDGEGVLWIGSTNGLTRFDPGMDEVRTYRHDPEDSLSLPKLSGITSVMPNRDSPDLLWIGFNTGGLCKFNKTSGSFFRYMPDTSNISDGRVTCILQSMTGSIWVGTKSGLNYFDPHLNQWHHFQHDSKNPNGLRSHDIKSLYEDEDNTLWVGTNGGGLNKLTWDHSVQYGIDQPEILHLTEMDGLPSEVIYGILKDKHGWLWLSTNNGLVRINPETTRMFLYNASDGLVGNEFNTGASLKASSAELYFGGVDGLTFFNPNDITINTHVPPLAFTEFQVFNQKVVFGPGSLLTRPIDMTQKILLSHRENVFSFQFTALDFLDPEKCLFAYRMEGFEEVWNEIGNRRFVTFTNLAAGDYVLHLRGSNNDAIWNQEGISIQISISPPWWETSWAMMGYSIIGIFILVFFWQYQMNRERLKNQFKLDHMKSRFFANISHEFRTPLTLILGSARRLLSGKVKENHRDMYAMQVRNGERLLKLVNELLDLSKLDVNKLTLNAQRQDMVAWLERFVRMMQSLADDHQVNLSFYSTVEHCEVWFDGEKFEQIMENLLTNAIKFTAAGGSVDLSFDCSNMAIIAVRDTGCGIVPEHLPYVFDRFFQADQSYVKNQAGSGIGLALTRELARLHKGEVTVESQPEKGSTFTVYLPLGMAHLKQAELASCLKESANRFKLNPFEFEGSEHENGAAEETFSKPEDAPLILIVEDHSDMRNYLREELTEAYHVIEAENGQAGYDLATDQIPDLIISDVIMPKRDGYQLCEKIKTDERTCHIPFIILTAKSSDESKMMGLQLGADDYLMKPFNSAELLVRVRNLLHLSHNLRERSRLEFQNQGENLPFISADQEFINRAMTIVEKQLQNPEFNVELFAREMGFSRSQLHRKLNGLLNQSASIFIRTTRLRRAALLLKKKTGTVSEIAYQVGFNSHDYFSKCFKEQYGVNPSKYE